MTGPAALIAACLLAPAQTPAPPAPPCEYHLAIFAAYKEPYKPQDTHTFAAVIRVTTDPATGTKSTDMVSISWLPANLKIRGVTLRGETGFNMPLRDTIDWVKAGGMCVSVWGPYPVRPELYDLFCQRVGYLEGCVRKYKALDGWYPHSKVSNCVHGVSEVVLDRGKPVGVYGFGERATAETLHALSPWLLDTTAEGADVLALFGVAECEVVRRPFCYAGPTRQQSMKSHLFKK